MGCNQILDRYIEQLIETSTPQAPAWNIEKLRAGKENTWNYIDGCMIKALIELYEITGEQRYLTFADDYIDFFVQDDGTIKHYNPQEYNLDNVNAGKTLYKLYDLVGKPKYRAAMDTIYRQLETQPRTKEGVFWHKAVYPNQIWLDGMYMAQPFYMQYELSFHNRRACSDSFHMFQVVHDLMRNPSTVCTITLTTRAANSSGATRSPAFRLTSGCAPRAGLPWHSSIPGSSCRLRCQPRRTRFARCSTI